MAWNFVFGTGASERINGADGVTNGDDFILGYNGSDIIHGLKGNDWLAGGAGGDVLDGGAGTDTAAYNGSPAGVFVVLANNGEDGSGYGGDAQGDTLRLIENLTGSHYADTLAGNEDENLLVGLGGNDTLKGYGGSDNLHGGEGDDSLWGMDDSDFLGGDGGHDTLWGMEGADGLLGLSGDDTLIGGDDDDGLYGGIGRDILEGGAGADTFYWSNDDTGATSATADVIVDFSPADGDLIDLLDMDSNVYAGSSQPFTFIGAAAFSGAPGEINFVYDNGDTIIQMQTGMSADVEAAIRITGIVTPDASWFVL
jgi:Ca2+-binding RTX toxin-like protein